MGTYAPTLVVQQAHALLRAWVCGEMSRLKAEIDRSVFISMSGEADPQDEHLALLKSIAFRMKCCQDLFAERTSDPQLGLCVDLLVHLAGCLPVTPNSAAVRPLRLPNQSEMQADPPG